MTRAPRIIYYDVCSWIAVAVVSAATISRRGTSLMPSPVVDRALALARVELSPRHRMPHPAAVATGTVLSIGLCLLADALLAKAGTALFPSTRGYVHFQRGLGTQRLPWIENGSGRMRHKVVVGLEALWHCTLQPRHEFCPRRRAGPLCRSERDPKAIVPHRIQLSHPAELLPDADAPLVRYGQPFGAAMGDVVRPGLPHDPFHGEDALVEKHYVSKRSRQQKGILAFLAQDADTRVFCYANAGLRKNQKDDEILRFITYWKQRTGHLPEELIFDSKLTTYANLNELNQMGIQFITLRRRSKKLVAEIARAPASAWRRIELESVSRVYKTPRVLDRQVRLKGYDGPLRQLSITDLGHEEPTLLLTNQLSRSACHLIGRYAKRMLIENNIEDGIDFFHMDALSSAVAMKVNCDLQLTLMASSLYRLLAVRVGNGYETSKSRQLFLDFINASADITITQESVLVKFQKRAHNPLLVAAGLDKMEITVPWLGGKRLRFVFG